ncbi:hypothetical protein QH494_10015 [Sphingomonas sp. AR_OL41]|uniref:hypothetical protein n=1 Tax=Sphingomonas sp. AR_OL41 TaxID=3042729 RepID=UPI00247FE76E|nr:hypothetical protein [Sphingomonas sp. AR_OL41]MDH7972517.1 hypothetical protein [Sphingomonas sp. AR_OL41]
MKLMGTPKLRNLATSGTDEMSGAVAALCAELVAIDWKSPGDVVRQYPRAHVDGVSVRIQIGDAHCVDLIVNYRAGIILIEQAGAAGESTAARAPQGSKAA